MDRNGLDNLKRCHWKFRLPATQGCPPQT
jgi:hypothetical protein